MLKKKIWAHFQRIIELFTKKIVKKLLKIWSWDPGSEIRDPEKTYSGSRGQKAPDPGSGSATLEYHNERVDLALKEKSGCNHVIFFIRMVLGFAHKMKRIRDTLRNISLPTLKYP